MSGDTTSCQACVGTGHTEHGYRDCAKCNGTGRPPINIEIDHAIPVGEIHVRSDGETVGKITNLGTERPPVTRAADISDLAYIQAALQVLGLCSRRPGVKRWVDAAEILGEVKEEIEGRIYGK